MADLQAASLADVHAFFTKWYGPNNATLVIAGDFDQLQAKTWIEKYFGELPSRDPVSALPTEAVHLDTTKRYYREDNFAPSPELTIVFPVAERFNEDSYPLRFLGRLLSQGKNHRFIRLLSKNEKWRPQSTAIIMAVN